MTQDIKSLKGVGVKKAKYLSALGIHTIDDLIWHTPKRYEDRSAITSLSDIVEDGKYTVRVSIESHKKIFTRQKKQMFIFDITDGSTAAKAIFINSPFITQYFKRDQAYYLYGNATINQGEITFFHPETRPESDGGFGIMPIYPLADGVTQRDLMQLNLQVKTQIEHQDEVLPIFILKDLSLMERAQALKELHFPSTPDRLGQAVKRFKFEELFNLQMALKLKKIELSQKKKPWQYTSSASSEYKYLFDFDLTDDQLKAIDAVRADLCAATPMNRLIQGDVGSGKTAVSIAAAYTAITNGYQVVMMAPTEILALQHYDSFNKALGNKFNVVCLTSSNKQKQVVIEQIASGDADVIVGTHAIIQEGVEFKRLSLVITDEQHRFGVGQRSYLSKRVNSMLDVLVMSATPIPRTLSLIIYGDMNISVIKQMPKGRLPIKTHYIKREKYKDMLSFISQRIAEGEQAYFVAPLIEESEKIDLKPAQVLYQELIPVFGDHNVALLHGKMKPQDKTAIMDAFKAGVTKVLVSTTVIEVGVDVPQATVMVITHTERFGLSQLHQLRGRVGRGDKQSYCFLVAEVSGKIAAERIKTMVQTNDGFEIANRDLEIRGPGEVLGVRQHGLPEFKFIDLTRDIDLIDSVRIKVETFDATLETSKKYIGWLTSYLTL